MIYINIKNVDVVLLECILKFKTLNRLRALARLARPARSGEISASYLL